MAKDINEARQVYLEQYGSALVTNTYLRIAVVVMSAVSLGLLFLTGSVYLWARAQKPLVVRIDDVGRATAVNYTAFSYRPEEPELRYFLAQFVQLHYGRMVATVEDRFSRSLYFLDSKLSQALIEHERREQTLIKFVREGTDEADVVIRNIALQDLRATPMKASVDFEKVYYSRADHQELRRESYAGYFEFIVNENIPNSFVLVNPLGLTITYFRADAAFK
jgi:type IV secretory pathway TrbF-like protein